jgi:hypothetical protein
MTEEENPFEQIQQFLENFHGEINIINEKIDIQLQMDYFDMSRELKKQTNDKDLIEDCNVLFNEKTGIETKKRMLVQLAFVDDPKAYRIIEQYSQLPDNPLKHWSMLALQESRMLMQSKLLDQSQVLISTGLGGKENKLRYFFALFTNSEKPFTEVQKKVVKNEFEEIFRKNESDIEEIHFSDYIATLVILVPLHIAIQNLFSRAIFECNQFGNFLQENCIITNVRIMSIDAIKDYINKAKNEKENPL